MIENTFLCLIRGYQYLIGPFLPPSCRFEVSCSEYTKQSIIRHGGVVRGCWLGLLRLIKCQSFL